jgi:signal transduction histidine kinase
VSAPANASIGRPPGRNIRLVAGRTGIRHLPERLPQRAGWMAFGAFAAFVVVGLAIRLPDGATVALAAAAVALAAGAVLFAPDRVLVVVWAVVAAGGVAVLGHGRSSNVGWFAVMVVGFWCALSGTRREALGFWAGCQLLFGAEWVWVQSDAGWAAWMAGATMALVGGLLIRHQFTLVAELRAAQADLADRARTEERNRIARDLHDVIAHSLTVSLLHVASARMAVQYDPAGAVRALEEAERLGRESLDEVRATVGLLRVDDEEQGGASGGGVAPPLPGAAELPALIQRFRSAGADVGFSVRGEVGSMPATTGLAVYRIVQEAVTNAVKHAPGAPVTVDLSVTDAAVELAVDSAGRPRSGSGSGLVSMRERAESLGGTLSCGPGGRGWLVRAALPLPADRAAETAT